MIIGVQINTFKKLSRAKQRVLQLMREAEESSSSESISSSAWEQEWMHDQNDPGMAR